MFLHISGAVHPQVSQILTAASRSMNVLSKWFWNLFTPLIPLVYLSETPNASQKAAEVAGAVRNPYFWLVWQLSSVLSQSRVLSGNRQTALWHRCFYCQSVLGSQTVSFKGRLAGQTHCSGSTECVLVLVLCVITAIFSLLRTLYGTRRQLLRRHFRLPRVRAQWWFSSKRTGNGQR